MRTRSPWAFAALALLAFVPDARAAQGTGNLEFFGRWDDPDPGTLPPTSSVSREFYVSATRGNDLFPGTVAFPKRTITNALTLVPDPQPWRATINVGPGVYDVAGGETFPIDIPAHGVCLEFWPEYATCDPAGVVDPETAVIAGDFTNPVVQIGSVGNQVLPASVVRALTINDGIPGVLVNPSLADPEPPEEPVAVELRQNVVFDCPAAIRVTTPADWEAFHVVEQNVLGEVDGPSGSFGYQETCTGTGSTLFRANEVMNFEFNVVVFGSGETCRPRLFSNFVQLGETNVNLGNCESEVRGNTIAYAIDHGGVDTVFGLIWSGAIELHNNVLWNPVAGSSALTATDITPAPPMGSNTNWIEDPAGNVPIPQFVGFGALDAHPGGFVADDLHLLPVSPLIGAGTAAEVANLALPATPYLEAAVGPFFVRTDVNADVDMQPRLSQTAGEVALTVDIGADEVDVSTISLVAPLGSTPFSQSATGDLLATAVTGTDRDFSFDLFFTGPPNGSWSLFLAYGFFDEVTNPVSTNVLPNGPVREHWEPGIGSLLFDPTVPNSNLVVGGTFDAAGAASLTGLALTGIDVHELEGEMYFQLVTLDPGGRAELSSRQYIELNDSFRGACVAPTTP